MLHTYDNSSKKKKDSCFININTIFYRTTNIRCLSQYWALGGRSWNRIPDKRKALHVFETKVQFICVIGSSPIYFTGLIGYFNLYFIDRVVIVYVLLKNCQMGSLLVLFFSWQIHVSKHEVIAWVVICSC
jgi:hypothetical protein